MFVCPYNGIIEVTTQQKFEKISHINLFFFNRKRQFIQIEKYVAITFGEMLMCLNNIDKKILLRYVFIFLIG